MSILQKNRAVATLAVASALIAIPALALLMLHRVDALWSAQLIETVASQTGRTEAEVRALDLSVSSLCTDQIFTGQICETEQWIRRSSLAAWICLLAGILISLAPFVARSFVGRNRTRLALVFTPLVRVITLAVGVLVAVQALIGTYAFYLWEVEETGRFHPKLLLAGLLGVLVGVALLITAARTLKQVRTLIVGVPLSRTEHGELFNEIDAMAGRIGAESPNNVVAGIEPSFYVTSGPAQLLDGTPLDGRTMFISLPFLRIFSLEEFRAVIGHELSHFKGDDTAYSLKFAPAYARLSHAIGAAGEGSAFQALANLPLSLTLQEFAETERTIGRDRELLADKGATDVAPPEALIRALIKVTAHSAVWSSLVQNSEAELSGGRAFRNLSALYSEIVRGTADEISIAEVKASMGESQMAHPIDTHPPLSARAEGLGVDLLAQIEPALLTPERSAIEILKGAANVAEESATDVQHRFAVMAGRVVLPHHPSE